MLEAGLTVQASKLVQQIRAISSSAGNSFDTEFAIKLDKALTLRAALRFLVAFEQRLAGKTVMNYSELMASILFEMTL